MSHDGNSEEQKYLKKRMIRHMEEKLFASEYLSIQHADADQLFESTFLMMKLEPSILRRWQWV